MRCFRYLIGTKISCYRRGQLSHTAVDPGTSVSSCNVLGQLSPILSRNIFHEIDAQVLQPRGCFTLQSFPCQTLLLHVLLHSVLHSLYCFYGLLATLQSQIVCGARSLSPNGANLLHVVLREREKKTHTHTPNNSVQSFNNLYPGMNLYRICRQELE